MSNSINLNTEKDMLVLQDKVVVSVKIVHEGKNRLDVQKVLKQKVHELFTVLKNYPGLESFTQQQKINPVYEQAGMAAGHISTSFPTHVVAGFMGEIYVGISTTDFTLLNEVLDKTQDMCELSQVQTSVSHTKLKEVENELTEKAIAEFKNRATLISQSFQFHHYSLKDVSVSSVSAQNNSYLEVATALSFSGSLETGATPNREPLFYIVPKQEKLAVRVQGTIELH